jgi:hypothetical protein
VIDVALRAAGIALAKLAAEAAVRQRSIARRPVLDGAKLVGGAKRGAVHRTMSASSVCRSARSRRHGALPACGVGSLEQLQR